MKRVGFLFEKICDPENIELAIDKASRQKRHHHAVARVLADKRKYAEEIRQILIENNYQPSPYKIREIKDGATGKIRTICCPKFYPDQIIHWAVMMPLQEVFMRGMYAWSAGGIPGRGAHRAMKRCQRWMIEDRKHTKYCLKLDIRKFYQSVDNGQMKARLRRLIKDERALALLDKIIDSHEGLPIGNYTSVWLSDLYLQDLDRHIKQTLGIKHYIRYVDDMVLFDSSKRRLHKARQSIEDFIGSRLSLVLKGNWQVFPLAVRDLDFLGYRINRQRVILRKRTALRIRRRIKRIARTGRMSIKAATALVSYWGMLVYCDSLNYRAKHVDPFVSINQAKRRISEWQKSRTQSSRRGSPLSRLEARSA